MKSLSKKMDYFEENCFLLKFSFKTAENEIEELLKLYFGPFTENHVQL